MSRSYEIVDGPDDSKLQRISEMPAEDRRHRAITFTGSCGAKLTGTPLDLMRLPGNRGWYVALKNRRERKVYELAEYNPVGKPGRGFLTADWSDD